mgnify:CR=1 FL=1
MKDNIFEEYLREKEPQKKEKGYAWHTAIGLQAVDGLETSQYLLDTAKKNIEGDITFEEAHQLINSYYKENIKHNTDDRTEEADKVSVRIAQLLSEKAFVLSPAQYISIHTRLFEGIYKHAGKIRRTVPKMVYNSLKQAPSDIKSAFFLPDGFSFRHKRSIYVA